jgi:hypothetical protein
MGSGRSAFLIKKRPCRGFAGKFLAEESDFEIDTMADGHYVTGHRPGVRERPDIKRQALSDTFSGQAIFQAIFYRAL